jgi:hypothetical protein
MRRGVDGADFTCRNSGDLSETGRIPEEMLAAFMLVAVCGTAQ